MTKLDKLINSFITGERYAWCYQLNMGEAELGGGYFYTRKACHQHLKAALRKIITNDSVLFDYLTMLAG